MSWLPISESKGILGGAVDHVNALTEMRNANELRKINAIKAQYAPLTTQAEAASKLAYANLMGPQFLAKIMGNDSALANMSEAQKANALAKIYQAGSGQGSGSGIFGQMQQPDQQDNSLLGLLSNKLKDSLGLVQPSKPNPLASADGNMLVAGQSMPLQNINPEYIAAHQNDITANNETVPNDQVLDYVAKNNVNHLNDNQIPLPPLSAVKQRGTYAENTGNYKGVVEEGVESGKIRAKDVEALNNTVFNGETNQATLNEVSDILASPTFQKIRNTPLAGHHELSYYAKEGNKEEQHMVGQYYTLTGNLIKDASRDFAGQFRKGEQQLLNGMKPSPSDTVDTAKGKTETLSVLNKMLTERSRLTSKIMSQYHVNKLQASEQADKLLDGDKIRKEVRDRLNPTVTIRNKTTGETKTISAEQARKLGVPNV